MDGDATLKLYKGTDVATALATVTLDKDYRYGTTYGRQVYYFNNPVVLNQDAEYFLALQATTGTSIILNEVEVSAASLLDGMDGNYSGGALTNTDGLMLAGEFNRARDVLAFNMTPGPTPGAIKGDSLQNFGKACTMRRCTSVGGYTSLRDGGDFNVMRYCLGLEYHRKGYNNAFKTTNWICVIGMHAESTVSSIEAAAGYQIDPEDGVSDFQRAIFRDCTGKPDVNTAATANGLKFAVLQDVYLDGCQFLHQRTTVTTLRFAEKVGRIRVKDTFLSREIHIEPGATPPPGYMLLERVIVGDGVQQPVEGIENARCEVMLLRDSTLQNYSRMAIEWDATDGTYALIAATNCDFNGYRNDDPTVDIGKNVGGTGQLNRSRKLKWLGNRRDNMGSGNAEFADSGFTDVVLGTTRDASMCVYENIGSPTGGLVTWNVGDIVVNSAPTSGGYYGWVCTSATSPPGTWKQWGSIA